MRIIFKIVFLLVVIAGAVTAYNYRREVIWFFSQYPQLSTVDQGTDVIDVAKNNSTRVVATGLDDPQDFVVLPDGSIIIAERNGTIHQVGERGWVASIDGIYTEGDTGLLGIAISPKFDQDHLIYVYVSAESDSVVRNRVLRFRLEDGKLIERTTICQGIPGGTVSNGGAIAFGPDGKLYVATGDTGNGALSQDQVGLAGKILRMNSDGTLPGDNPAENFVWAMGFHDPKGLAWDAFGHLWVVDRGATGSLGGHDEINQVEPGKNYGWPQAVGMNDGTVSPKAASGSLESWEPSGLVYLRPNLYFGGMRGESLYSLDTSVQELRVTGYFQRQLGRIRAVRVGADGGIYLMTNNTDGYGLVRPEDDKIYRLDTKLLGR